LIMSALNALGHAERPRPNGRKPFGHPRRQQAKLLKFFRVTRKPRRKMGLGANRVERIRCSLDQPAGWIEPANAGRGRGPQSRPHDHYVCIADQRIEFPAWPCRVKIVKMVSELITAHRSRREGMKWRRPQKA